MTLFLLWEEYQSKCRSEGTLPVGKTKFYEGYQDFVISRNLTNHLEHKSGEKVEVDWSGKTMSYVIRDTGEIIPVNLFVATLVGGGDFAFLHFHYATNNSEMPVTRIAELVSALNSHV